MFFIFMKKNGKRNTVRFSFFILIKKLKNELLKQIKNNFMIIVTSIVYTLFKSRFVEQTLANSCWKKLISYILAIKNEEFFFTIVFLFKLKKYQLNTGTAACNLCSNFPGTYLHSFPIKQSNPSLHPEFWLKLLK